MFNDGAARRGAATGEGEFSRAREHYREDVIGPLSVRSVWRGLLLPRRRYNEKLSQWVAVGLLKRDR